MELNAVELAKLTEPTVQPELQPVISLTELLNAVQVIESRETEDKRLIESLSTIDETDLRNRLISWATSGFPDLHILYSIQLSQLEQCSDGVVRNNVLDYFQYLSPTVSISDIVMLLQTKLQGMDLSYSYTNDFTVRVHVSRK